MKVRVHFLEMKLLMLINHRPVFVCWTPTQIFLCPVFQANQSIPRLYQVPSASLIVASQTFLTHFLPRSCSAHRLFSVLCHLFCLFHRMLNFVDCRGFPGRLSSIRRSYPHHHRTLLFLNVQYSVCLQFLPYIYIPDSVTS